MLSVMLYGRCINLTKILKLGIHAKNIQKRFIDEFYNLTYKNHQQMIFLHHPPLLSYLLEEQMGRDVRVRMQWLMQDLGI